MLEVGLGGRGDATNVIARPAACAITSISLDHREMLGDTLAAIAMEKAGIMKPGVPVVTGSQDAAVLAVLTAQASRAGSPLLGAGPRLDRDAQQGGLALRRSRKARWSCRRLRCSGRTSSTMPASPSRRCGPRASRCPTEAMARGVATAVWPARMQRLTGRLAALLPEGWELWLDGGHNPGAGVILAEHLAGWSDRPVHLVVGMKHAKDSAEFLRPLMPHAASIWAVAEPGQYLALPVEAIIAASGGVARSGPVVATALKEIAGLPGPARVLICGSLYLAGEVLKADEGLVIS